MPSFEAYRTTVELTDTTVEIHRVGLMAKAAAAHVSVPLAAVAATHFVKATAMTNGTLQIVLTGGGATGKAQPTDPYTIVFRKKQAAGIDELNSFLEKWAAYNVENPTTTGQEVERVVGRMEGIAQRAEERHQRMAARLPEKHPTFEKIQLANGVVSHPDGGGPVAGAKAVVDSAGEIHRRITASRIVLVGVFALAWRKKKDERELYLLIDGPGWAIAVPVPPTKGAEARAFAAQINAAGSVAPEASTAALERPSEPSPIEQIDQLAGLRDRGILSADEFEAKKHELLGRL